MTHCVSGGSKRAGTAGRDAWRTAPRACRHSCQPLPEGGSTHLHCLQFCSRERLHAAPLPLACLEEARPVLAWLPPDSGLPGYRDRSRLTRTHYDFSLSGVSTDGNVASSDPPVGWLPASSSRNERALAYEHGSKIKQLERKNDPLDTWKLTASVKYIRF